MNNSRVLSITNARKKIFQIIDDVNLVNKPYTLTENGVPKAVIVSAEEYNSWLATIELLEEDPNILNDIKKAEEEFKRGEYVTLEELMDELGYSRKDNFLLRDKPKNKYRVTKRAKKI